ncbi:MAG: cation-translocating P-type ATPase [Calditerrivibrio sp.]|nr:cation-translocating P-type ATPase [Calditerrivibrio sp.]MCA1932225.1 cation-translocating P-type ATPase [Calditerrivibrio sp.]
MKNNDSLVECSHCLLKVKKNSAIVEELTSGEKLYFCCSGCHSVYHFVKDGGLEKFYEIRKDYIPGQVKRIKVTDELFKDDIKVIDENTLELPIFVSDIRCAACIWLIENSISKLNGVKYVRVNYATHKMLVHYDSSLIELNNILSTITNLGYCPIPSSLSSTNSIIEDEKRNYFVRFGVASFFSMQIMLYSVALYAGYFQGISHNLKNMFTFITFLLATPVIFYAGKPFFINSIKSLKNRTLNMDILIFMGSFFAYSYSIYAMLNGKEVYFDSSAMIITLILLGRFIESSIKLKASKEMLLLKALQPQQVKKVYSLDEDLEDITGEVHKIDDLKVGDLLIVYEGETIPVDGTILKGVSDVDEAMLTGESIPVTKSVGNIVFSGTKNISGKIVIRAEKDFKNSTVSKIIEAIEKAQNTTFKTQKAVDKIISVFVPSIILISFATFFIWFYLSNNLELSIINAVSVLVISCPCALGIATPLALMISTNIAAKNGIIVKNGDIIEDMKWVKDIFFDKTGTLTEGKLTFSNITTFNGFSVDEVVSYAASLEKYSEHPIAKSLIDYYEGDLKGIKSFKEIPGNGIEGITLNNETICVGNVELMKKNNVELDYNILELMGSEQLDGKIVVFVSINAKLAGMISFKDQIKSNVKEIFEKLLLKGYKLHVLTGDSEKSTYATLAPIKDYAEISTSLTPFEKAEIIKKFIQDGRKNIFVGDGINDAPSIKNASIGIAMGSGSELAIETSDAVIMNSNIATFLKFLNLVKFTNYTIKANLFWAFMYNIIMIPLAATGHIHPIISAGFMSISSIIVVLNSVGLRFYRLT